MIRKIYLIKKKDKYFKFSKINECEELKIKLNCNERFFKK